MKKVFTSESVTEGHPDKVCDQISDTILDSILESDPDGRVACETLVTTNLVIISGEITTKKHPDYKSIVRKTVDSIGYNNDDDDFNSSDIEIRTYIDEQSPHISQGVDIKSGKEQGAGDQGLMFGYACKDTPELMPLPIQLSHRLTEELTIVRKNKKLDWLKPDGKAQVSVEYDNGIPSKVKQVVIATQHKDMSKNFEGNEDRELEFIKKNIIKFVIKPVLDRYSINYDEDFIVNGTGRFVEGGPKADTGLTGRKIIVDTYGGFARHGGGAFSGKDPSKVDRSASYLARYIAKNIVASNLADRCEVQLSYCIGVADPSSVYVDTFGTGKIDDLKLTQMVTSQKIFNLKPYELINDLKLKRPIYKQLSSYGHFGRNNDNDFYWEKCDKVDEIIKFFK